MRLALSVAVALLICPLSKAESVPVGNPTFGLYTFTDADSGAPLACIGNVRPEVDTDSRDLYKVYYNLDGSYIGREIAGEVSKDDVANIKKGKISPALSAKVQDHLKNPSKYSKEITVAKTHMAAGGGAHGMHGGMGIRSGGIKVAPVKASAVSYKKK
jgi:hypothetical protein